MDDFPKDAHDKWKTSEAVSEFDGYEPKPTDPCVCGHDYKAHTLGKYMACSGFYLRTSHECDCIEFRIDERAFVREAAVRAANWEPWKD